MDLNLKINKELTKEVVYEKLERFQSLPMVLQTLENNNQRNDQLYKQLKFLIDFEFENIQRKVEETQEEGGPEAMKEAIEDNGRIFKENLKKITRLMGKGE